MIKPISFTPINYNFKNNKNINLTKPKQLQYDTVSFTGHKKAPKQLSENVQRALSLAKVIYRELEINPSFMSSDNLEKLLSERANVKVNVRDMKDIQETYGKKYEGRLRAHVIPSYRAATTNEDMLDLSTLEIDDFTMSLDFSTRPFDLIEDIAHEYTHKLQKKADDPIKILVKIAKNEEELEKIASICDRIFRTNKDCCIDAVFGKVRASNYERLIRNRQNNEQSVIKILKDNNIKTQMEKDIDLGCDTLNRDFGINKDQAKDVIKQYIKRKGEMEAEAHTTGMNVVEKYDKKNSERVVENQIFIDIYKHLAECV